MSVMQDINWKHVILFWLAGLAVVIVLRAIIPRSESENPQILGIEFSLERGNKQFWVRRIETKDPTLEMTQYGRILRKPYYVCQTYPEIMAEDKNGESEFWGPPRYRTKREAAERCMDRYFRGLDRESERSVLNPN